MTKPGLKPAKTLRRHLRLATAWQLWRLNEQGALALVVNERSYEPGAEASATQIDNAQADVVLSRLKLERWRGLPDYPRNGETWTVRDGRVVSLGMALEENSRT